MYVDLDVYFRDKASIFDTVPADHSICCLYDTSEDLSITATNTYFNKFKKDFRNPEAKYWNAHAMLVEEDLEPDNYVFNTGIIITSKKCMEQLDYFSDIDEVLENMKELKEYMEAKKKANALKWMNVDGYDTIQGFTQKEFNESVKQIKRKTSTTRRSHSKGNLLNQHNLPRIKQDIL